VLLNALRTLRTGVPARAGGVRVVVREPHRIADCGPGYQGDLLHQELSPITSVVWFTSTGTVRQVEDEVVARPYRHGWRLPVRSGPFQWYGTPSTAPFPRTPNSTLMDDWFVDRGRGPGPTTSQWPQGRLTSATLASGCVAGQPVLGSISATMPPHGPVGWCGGP